MPEAKDTMATQRQPDLPPHKIALYEKLIATNPKIERKGAPNPYTSLNGPMLSLLHSGVMALR